MKKLRNSSSNGERDQRISTASKLKNQRNISYDKNLTNKKKNSKQELDQYNENKILQNSNNVQSNKKIPPKTLNKNTIQQQQQQNQMNLNQLSNNNLVQTQSLKQELTNQEETKQIFSNKKNQQKLNNILDNFLQPNQDQQQKIQKKQQNTFKKLPTVPKGPNLRTNERGQIHKQNDIYKKYKASHFDKVNNYIQQEILKFCATDFNSIFLLMRICKRFYHFVNNCYEIWESVLKTLSPKQKEQFQIDNHDYNQISNDQKLIQIKKFITNEEKKLIIKNYDNFFNQFRKLHNYGSTKENIPNKLIDSIDLTIDLQINGKYFYNYKFVKNKQNFSSHLLIKITEIQQFKISLNEKIQINLRIFSGQLKTSVQIQKLFITQNLLEQSIYQKAFNFYVDKNFLFSYFNGDETFLYILFEISAIELLIKFKDELKKRLVYQEKKSLKVKNEKQKFFQKELNYVKYENLIEYIKYQTDFELIFKIHNSEKKNLFEFINVKSFPLQFDDQQAIFVQDLNEDYLVENVFKLDNKMGMQEVVKDLILVDLVLKDRENFIICFSGFSKLQTLDQEQKLQFKGNFDFIEQNIEARIIKYVQPNLYQFSMLIIQQGNFQAKIKKIEIILFKEIIKQWNIN